MRVVKSIIFQINFFMKSLKNNNFIFIKKNTHTITIILYWSKAIRSKITYSYKYIDS